MNMAQSKPVETITPASEARKPVKASTDTHDWQEMIATAAYYRAEKRGFEGGMAEQDWYEAESELRERFSRGGGI